MDFHLIFCYIFIEISYEDYKIKQLDRKLPICYNFYMRTKKGGFENELFRFKEKISIGRCVMRCDCSGASLFW
ncbi:hypothetical protein CLONEX_02725 [[Clostridium] nexile DSM 1787]|nr:hypothetical protein CLONEX_02725 [[Clostridium] nexile DSM 1787]